MSKKKPVHGYYFGLLICETFNFKYLSHFNAVINTQNFVIIAEMLMELNSVGLHLSHLRIIRQTVDCEMPSSKPARVVDLRGAALVSLSNMIHSPFAWSWTSRPRSCAQKAFISEFLIPFLDNIKKWCCLLELF
jgi:hypothetical protein